jgi:hypothetical protein
MRRYLGVCLALACAPLLAACPATTDIPAPNTVADATVLDERAAIGVELAYRGWRIAVETAVEAGIIRGERAAAFAETDRRLYAAVRAARAAYGAGNAADYAAAVDQANAAIAQALAAIRGN